MMKDDPGNTGNRQSHVSVELNELRKSIDNLEETLARARQRFSSVVYVPPPSELEKKPEAQTLIVPLAHDIRETRLRIRTAVNDLQNVIDNCEL